jgi:ribonuclease J
MRVRIHRGAHEIGGSCVEVEAEGSRLVLDVGRPLSAGRNEVVPLPPVPGFAELDPSLVGVVISHAHQDHWGLVDQVPPRTPVFIGEATHRILAEAAFWSSGATMTPAGFLTHRGPFDVGPFTLTPYLNDHSAFDAYSVLVEADGHRLFYSGDIRGHGRKAGIFEELLRKPPGNIDVLLMEGTNIRPYSEATENEPAVSEADLEAACVQEFKSTAGMVLAVWSAQNIDRLVTFYRAALRSDRDLVVDLYTASIARATGNPNIPQPGPDWPKIHVYVPQWQRRKILDAQAFSRVDEIKPYRLFEEDLAADPGRYVLQFHFASGPRLANEGALTGAKALWSLWKGYLDEGSGKKLQEFLAAHQVPMAVRHTSGHASVSDLQRLATALAPTRLVPIHSLGGHRFADLFNAVDPQPDGHWWGV